MHPRGSTCPSTAQSSCTSAHQPTENGEAEPQSIERNRSHSGEIANGSITCRLLSQQSKNAPRVTLQLPSSHALTSSCEPEARSRCLYASTSMCWLLSTCDGMNTRSSPVTGSRMMRLPKGPDRCSAPSPTGAPAPRVSRRTQTDWHACAGAQRRHQLHHWGGAREIPDLLYINSRVVVALVHVGIGIALQIGEAQPGAVRRTPHLFGFVERPSQRPVDLPRSFDGFHQLGTRATYHQADRILAIPAGVSAELAEHPIGLAAAAGATEEDFEHLALQQPHLGRVATRRPSNPNLGLVGHGAIVSVAPSPPSAAQRSRDTT